MMFIVSVGLKPNTQLACFAEMDDAFEYIKDQYLEQFYDNVFIAPVEDDEDLYYSINR